MANGDSRTQAAAIKRVPKAKTAAPARADAARSFPYGLFLLTAIVGSALGVVALVHVDHNVRHLVGAMVLQSEKEHGTEYSTLKRVLGIDLVANEEELWHRMQKRDFDSVRTLLGVGVSADARDERGVPAIEYAIAEGLPQLVDLLIVHHANLNTADSEGNTPLLLALRANSSPLLSKLLAHGADVNGVGKEGNAALHTAVAADDLALVKLLLSYRANPNVTDAEGRTPLHLAIGNENLAVVKLLLDGGGNFNVQDAHAATPLILAVSKRNRGIVETLVQRGADPDAKNREGKSPRDLALDMGMILEQAPDHSVVFRARGDVKQALPEQAPGQPDAAAGHEIDGAPMPEPEAQPAQANRPRPRPTPAATPAAAPHAAAAQTTRLRVVGDPAGVWTRGKQGMTLNSVSVKVRNVGDYPATNVSVNIVLPGGKSSGVDGPTTLGPNEMATYTRSMTENVSGSAKLRAEASCGNCRARE